jgi:hypothetical protein
MDIITNLQKQEADTNVRVTPGVPEADAIEVIMKTDSIYQNDEKKQSTPSTAELDHDNAPLQSRGVSWSLQDLGNAIVKFAKFTGPGAIISVAYIDPDNFQTAISAGAQFKYKLLFMILVSNIIAVYLQVSETSGYHNITYH